SGMSEAEIDKMINDARLHEQDDREKRRKIDTRNNADAMVFQTEKNLKEYGDKLDPDGKAKIEAGIERVREALKTDNVAEMESSVEALTQLWQNAASTMYQQAADGAQTGSDSGPGAGQEGARDASDSTVDADYEVVDEK
ncbi:MAG: Hsp70 family protein, partial [Candidatus Zixiibacteriota bacterium]